MMPVKYEIIGRPYYAIVRVSLGIGDRFFGWPAAVIAMDTNISWKDSEYPDQRLFYADTYPGEILFAGTNPGDLNPIDLGGQTIYVRSNSLIGFYGEISIDSKWGGSGEFFSDEKIVLLKISGNGTIFLAPKGIIYKKWIQGTYFIDEDHIVAFEEILRFKPMSNMDGSGRQFFSFNGGGNAYIQW